VLGFVLVLALGACGSGRHASGAPTSKVSTARLVAGAADAAAREQTARFDGYVNLRTDTKDATVPVRGAFDTEHGALTMTLEANSFVPDADGTIEVRMVRGAMYVDLGELAANSRNAPRSVRERPWIKVAIPGDIASAGTQNFGDQLAALRGAGDVRARGHERIRGVETTRYHAEVDVQRALDAVSRSDRTQVEQALKLFGPSLPIDVWIDGHGLPRRMVMTIHATGNGSSATIDEHLDFFDFGADVSVATPPADLVQSMDEFRRAMARA
jgi:hypothetical protein